MNQSSDIQNKKLTIVFIVICTEHQSGETAGRIFTAIDEFISTIKRFQNKNDLSIYIDELICAHDAQWSNDTSIPLDQYEWKPPQTGGKAKMSNIVEMLKSRFSTFQNDYYAPIFYLFSGNTKAPSEKWDDLNSSEIFRDAIRIAVPIGDITNNSFFQKFAADRPERILPDTRPETLKKGLILKAPNDSPILPSLEMPSAQLNRENADEQQIPALKLNNAQFQQANDDLQKKLNNMSREKEDLRNKLNNMSREKEDLLNKLNNMSREKEDLRKECTQLKTQLTNAENNCSENARQIDDLLNKLNDANREKDDLQNQCTQLKTQLTNAENNCSENARQINDLQKSLNEVSEEKAQLCKEVSNLQNLIQDNISSTEMNRIHYILSTCDITEIRNLTGKYKTAINDFPRKAATNECLKTCVENMKNAQNRLDDVFSNFSQTITKHKETK